MKNAICANSYIKTIDTRLQMQFIRRNVYRENFDNC